MRRIFMKKMFVEYVVVCIFIILLLPQTTFSFQESSSNDIEKHDTVNGIQIIGKMVNKQGVVVPDIYLSLAVFLGEKKGNIQYKFNGTTNLLKATTNSEGKFIFKNVPPGKYIMVYKFDLLEDKSGNVIVINVEEGKSSEIDLGEIIFKSSI